MDARSFLDNFGTVVDSPGGVPRLRNLLLSLAVRGRVVDQIATEEPAEILLDQVERERAALIGAGRLRKQRHRTPPPASCPPGWAAVDLGAVLDLEYGKSLPAKSRDQSGSIPVYGSNGVVGVHTVALVTQPCVVVGRKGSAGAVNISRLPSWPIDTTYFVEPLGGMSVEFTALLLRAARLDELDRATAVPGLNREEAYAIPILLPPLAEQERIVAKLEELMRLCDDLQSRSQGRTRALTRFRRSALHALTDAPTPDDLRRAWGRAAGCWRVIADGAEASRQLRKTFAELAIEGRLSAPRRGDLPADTILEDCRRRKEELVESRARVRSDLTPISEADLPFGLPEGWTVARLDLWCDLAGGLAKGRKTRGRPTTLLPYLRVANVKAGYLALGEIKHIEVPVDEVDRYSLAAGDVLLTEGGDWDKLGRSAVWSGEIDACVHQNHVFRARPLSADLRPEWVSLYTNSEAGRAYFQSKAKRTTNLASINMTELRSMPLPVPPIAEQQRILMALNGLTNHLSGLEEALARRSNIQERLAAGLMAPSAL